MRTFIRSLPIIGAAAMLSGSLAFAQAVITPPVKPLNTFGITPAGDCKIAVSKARHDEALALGLQNGTWGQGAQMSAKVHLDAAEIAYARGNENECWRQLGWSKYFIH